MPADIAQWAATGTGILAATMVAADLGRRVTGWAFVIFTGSSILWTAFAAAENDHGLLTQNAVLTVINIYGVYRYLILKKA